jgi:hypothetical protein
VGRADGEPDTVGLALGAALPVAPTLLLGSEVIVAPGAVHAPRSMKPKANATVRDRRRRLGVPGRASERQIRPSPRGPRVRPTSALSDAATSVRAGTSAMVTS